MTTGHQESSTTLGASRYPVERELGRGATAVVYLARDPKHGRRVALKVLREELTATLQAERFLREIQIAAGLSHPHVVPLYDSGEVDGRLYYVMPFVDGESLRQRLERERPLPIADAVRVATEVAGALDYAHRRGVVHRDIKPENILIEEGHAVVADFGIARALTSASVTSLTMPGLGLGTAAYMSPEQAVGELEIDGRSDVYSLGCVLYEMLTGEQPFKGSNLQAVIARRFMDAAPSVRALRPEVPASVAAVVDRALAREPGERYETAGGFAEALAEAVRSADVALAASRAPGTSGAPLQVGQARAPTRAEATGLVGREGAIAQLRELLEQDQLVTILGPGGVGKSRLAREIAAADRADRDRCYVVPLAAVASPQYLAASVAEALGLGGAGGRDPRLQVLDFLRGRSALLVLDNFEHLVAGAPLLAEILDAAPGVRLLVTSRQRLNLQRETVYELPPLPVPSSATAGDARESAAVRLFLAHARRHRPDVRSWEAELPAIVRICRSVEGLPLGIEIAAALLRALSCEEIAAELEASLDSLVTPLRDVPERHRSLRTVFEQSWSLLDDSERESLAKLSVFRGSFERTAGERVAGASLPVLTALIDKSLVARAGTRRYQLHDLVRQHAAAKLRAIPTIREATEAGHAAFFADYVRSRERRLEGRAQQAALDDIAIELGNIRAGWQWALQHGGDDLVGGYGAGLYRYYTIRAWFREGADDLGVVEQLERRSAAVGHLLGCYGNLCWRLGQTAKARELFRRSVSMLRAAGADAATVLPLRGLANVATDLGKYRAANRLHARCVQLCRASGDRYELALSLTNWSIPLMQLGRYAEVEERLRESMEIHEELGNVHGLAVTMLNLANALQTQDKLAEALAPLEEGLRIARQLGSQFLIAAASLNLGNLRSRSGETGDADALLRESVAQFREIGVRDGLATALVELGNVAIALGKYEEAASHIREALACAVQINATSLVLRVLVSVADLLASTGERERALSALRAVVAHPASRDFDLRRARALLAKLGDGSATPTSTGAGQRASARDLRAIVEEFLGGPAR